MPFLGSIKQGLFGRFFLSLPHRNVSELFITGRDVILGCHSFHLRRRVNSREQHKESRDALGGLSESIKYVEGWLLYILLTHHLTYKGSEG